MDKAVILARGLGTRMQKADNSGDLTEEQVGAAETGVKGMIPIGRPFLDYVISELADAGFRRICLVIGPEHGTVRNYYQSLTCQRVGIEFAIQAKPLGTADAVIAAESFVAGESFVVINCDNYYPVQALEALRQLEEPGLVGFDREAMLQGSNIPRARIKDFAVVQIDDGGYLVEIIEKPRAKVLAKMPRPVCVSMNCWRFSRSIFTGCRSISPSARGELELPDAVQYAVDSLGERFRVVPVRAAVLDLSRRRDIPAVAARLRDVEVSL
jgi:dTDP-glucose pyrophosphorylase